jgi:hypothetical protein
MRYIIVIVAQTTIWAWERLRRNDSNKMYPEYIWLLEGIDWMYLAEDTNQLRVLLNTSLDLWVLLVRPKDYLDLGSAPPPASSAERFRGACRRTDTETFHLGRNTHVRLWAYFIRSTLHQHMIKLVCQFVCVLSPFLWKDKKTPWSVSASELYRPSDRRLSAKWLPTFADKGCHVVSVTDSFGRILGFLERSRYFSIK